MFVNSWNVYHIEMRISSAPGLLHMDGPHVLSSLERESSALQNGTEAKLNAKLSQVLEHSHV